MPDPPAPTFLSAEGRGVHLAHGYGTLGWNLGPQVYQASPPPWGQMSSSVREQECSSPKSRSQEFSRFLVFPLKYLLAEAGEVTPWVALGV